MKKFIYASGCTGIILYLLLYPQEALSAARDGMNLWLNVIIPTLLPFLILTGILLRTEVIERLLKPMKKGWKICLGISAAGAYALLVGILCGYPMGAKITSDLYENQKIEKREAEYLLTFTNHASPIFVRTYLCRICLNDTVSFGESWGILLFSAAFVMLFFRFLVFRNKICSQTEQKVLKKKTSVSSSSGALLDVSIMNGFETITRIGGYILLFSILSSCIRHLWISENIAGCLISGILELTTGLYQLQDCSMQITEKYMLSMFMTAFGGICIMLQTRSLTTEKLSLRYYMIAKMMNGIIAALTVLFITKIV